MGRKELGFTLPGRWIKHDGAFTCMDSNDKRMQVAGFLASFLDRWRGQEENVNIA